MPKRFVPVALELIDEGHYLEDVNKKLQEVAAALVAHVRKHGHDCTVGAKAVLTAKVTLKFDGPEPGDFSIRADVQASTPGRPPSVSRCLDESTDDGTQTLFVRKTGSTADDPRQAILCTSDGQVVDPATGEVLPAKKTTAKAK